LEPGGRFDAPHRGLHFARCRLALCGREPSHHDVEGAESFARDLHVLGRSARSMRRGHDVNLGLRESGLAPEQALVVSCGIQHRRGSKPDRRLWAARRRAHRLRDAHLVAAAHHARQAFPERQRHAAVSGGRRRRLHERGDNCLDTHRAPRLLERVGEETRLRHYTIRTESAYAEGSAASCAFTGGGIRASWERAR